MSRHGWRRAHSVSDGHRGRKSSAQLPIGRDGGRDHVGRERVGFNTRGAVPAPPPSTTCQRRPWTRTRHITATRAAQCRSWLVDLQDGRRIGDADIIGGLGEFEGLAL